MLKKTQHSSVLWIYLQLLRVKVSTLQKELNAWWCGPTYAYFRSVELKFVSYFSEFTVYMLCVEQRFCEVWTSVQTWTKQQANLDSVHILYWKCRGSMRCSVCLLHSKTILFLSVNCLFRLIQKNFNRDSELSWPEIKLTMANTCMMHR